MPEGKNLAAERTGKLRSSAEDGVERLPLRSILLGIDK
jgi:hypothetical protein